MAHLPNQPPVLRTEQQNNDDFEELGFGPDDMALFTALATASAVAGWTFWGRVADRAGNIPVLVFGMFVWEISNVLWAFLHPGNSWLLYLLFLWSGFFSVGLRSGFGLNSGQIALPTSSSSVTRQTCSEE
jgi:MFS family permease